MFKNNKAGSEQVNNQVEIYQLYIWIKGISPMISRRLLVRSDTSIYDIHHYVQIIMGWEDYHLNQFKIRQGSYGVYHSGGMNFLDDPREVCLSNFDFRINEKFIYEYNFHVPWEHEIRVEKKLLPSFKKKYPVCISGKNAGPSEDPDSIDEFVELLESSKGHSILFKFYDALNEYKDGELDREELMEIIDNLTDLHDKFVFNRKDINQALQDYPNNENEK